MVRQWTLGSAITHLRSFVRGVEVEQGDVSDMVVTSNMVEECKLDREARLAARNMQVDAAEPVSMEVSPPPVQESALATLAISTIPPADQDQIFPSSLHGVPSSPCPTLASMSSLPTTWLPIIARDPLPIR
jgi:hypothetical protein